MSIVEKLTAIKDTIPHYWPIGAFIHHNPLKGFEDMNFKDALPKAQEIFGGNVYMDSSYYLGLYDEGKIQLPIFEKNLLKILKENNLESELEEAKKFLMEISPDWDSFRSYKNLKTSSIDSEVITLLEKDTLHNNKDAYVKKLLNQMTLYEIHDAIFATNEQEMIAKEIIEYISRFLDEAQTTIHMENRDLGMFNTFKIYENFEYEGSAESYVETALEKLKVKNVEDYFLTHILKLHGWAGFIKYRSEADNYFPQSEHPSSLIDYLAIRLYFELKYTQDTELNDFEKLEKYIDENYAYSCLKLLQSRGKLPGEYIDQMEEHEEYDDILKAHLDEELRLDALQLQTAKQRFSDFKIETPECINFMKLLKKEEGFIWLKSLEDSYISTYVDEFTKEHTKEEEKALATATFCLDVRSETIRRKIEEEGAYKTFGAGGFLGLPLAFVEFDKAHEVLLAPAIVKPQNIVFEVPLEDYEGYSNKKTINKTTKKVLTDLKNNPYTPYIMVEAIGWAFSVNLFGNTFFPRKTNALFGKIKPTKPKTTYTLDKLSDETIKEYIQKLHQKMIKEELIIEHIEMSDEDIETLWKHLVFNDSLDIKVSETLLYRLRMHYQITEKDYLIQKEKLLMVGFTLDEKVHYLENFLKLIGNTKEFSKFFTIIGHGSCSDNNPFESALDCGACGGSISLPNARALCMIANKRDVREALAQKGIEIPEATRFIPGIHITTTDEIKFYDTDILALEELIEFNKVKEDFNKASFESREERIKSLPNTNTQEDIFVKSMDWSEPRPEWGLAGNIGVFAGPRSSTKNMEFNNRLFMHSYDWTIDNDNADILTKIFDGPLVIGEWINMEHYFATVDNKVYGAGSKVYHNIVSKVGVFNGNYSDLKIGLPTQSVITEGKAYHEPVRLLTFMEAPLEKVGKAVENSIAKPFILNEWIRPIIIDKEAKKVYSYEDGDFIVIKELD